VAEPKRGWSSRQQRSGLPATKRINKKMTTTKGTKIHEKMQRNALFHKLAYGNAYLRALATFVVVKEKSW